jgi:Arc/MetJ-type ribon-helix-helix transcriptional regulator
MEKISISLPSEQVRRLEDMVGTKCDNRSEAARKTIEKGFEHDELEQQVERLQNEKRLILEQREDHNELIRHVEDEREEREQRRERRNAPVWRRAKWWVLGRSESESEA